MGRVGRTPLAKDVEMAKRAVWWDDEADDKLATLFPPDNDPGGFTGDKDDLRAIRRAMKHYEKREAAPAEDQAYYHARFRLQFVEVRE